MDKLTLEECGCIFWLAARDIVFLSMYKELDDERTNGFSVAINCNDTFCYAAADAEDLAPNKTEKYFLAIEHIKKENLLET